MAIPGLADACIQESGRLSMTRGLTYQIHCQHLYGHHAFCYSIMLSLDGIQVRTLATFSMRLR